MGLGTSTQIHTVSAARRCGLRVPAHRAGHVERQLRLLTVEVPIVLGVALGNGILELLQLLLVIILLRLHRQSDQENRACGKCCDSFHARPPNS
jgi:hypothetical protein